MMPEPFEVHVSESVLADLRDRIRKTRWPDSVLDSGWNYGAEMSAVRRLADYWEKRFDWRKEEAFLNSLPHFRLKIEDLNVHFVHIKSPNPEAIPLILTHGWPGSFLEELKLIPLLRDSFHLVIPSMPGYGFSEASRVPGMTARRIARMWVQLMRALGYEKFITQGGDWGATVSTWLGLDAPQSVIGIHLNYIPGSYKPYLRENDSLTDREKDFLRGKEEWVQNEGAYGQVQGTKPQSLAFAMNDSPVGMAAWILEKAKGWSACDGDVFDHFTFEELLTNITLYWVTQTFGSSTRLYYEARRSPLQFQPGQRVNVPCAIAVFAREEPMPPREWVERSYHVARWTEYPVGSHFAPIEVPELLAADILESAKQFVR